MKDEVTRYSVSVNGRCLVRATRIQALTALALNIHRNSSVQVCAINSSGRYVGEVITNQATGDEISEYFSNIKESEASHVG